MAEARGRRAVPYLLGLAFWMLYQFTASQQFTYDGLCYALDAERGPATNLFHPNHLLYSALSRLWIRMAEFADFDGPGIFLMQSANAAVAGVSVGLFAWMLGRRLSLIPGLLAAFLYGVSAVHWFEAADPGCYAWASLATVAALGLLLCEPSNTPIRTGILHGVLVLFHQMLVLVAPAFWWIRRPSVVRYSAGLLGTVLAAYGLVALRFHGTSLYDALYWALGPAGPPPGVKILSAFWWSVDLPKNAAASWSAFASSLVAPGAGAAGTVAALWVLGSAVWGTVLALRASPPGGALRRSVWACWVWVGVLNLFQFFFAIGMIRYRMMFLPPLIYLAALSWRGKWPGVVLIGVLTMTGLNLNHSVLPRMSPPPDAARVAWLKTVLTPRDWLIYESHSERSITNVYLVYFAPEIRAQSLSGYRFSVPGGDLGPLEARMKGALAEGRRVWLEEGLSAKWKTAWKKGKTLEGPDGYRIFQVR